MAARREEDLGSLTRAFPWRPPTGRVATPLPLASPRAMLLVRRCGRSWYPANVLSIRHSLAGAGLVYAGWCRAFLSVCRSVLTNFRMGELAGWMDESFIRSVFSSSMNENVQVKIIRDRHSG